MIRSLRVQLKDASAAFLPPWGECLISSHQILHVFVSILENIWFISSRKFLSGNWEARISCFNVRLSDGKCHFLKISVIQYLIMKIFIQFDEREYGSTIFSYSSPRCKSAQSFSPQKKEDKWLFRKVLNKHISTWLIKS